MSIPLSGPEKVAPIPPFLSPGQLGPAELSCPECSERPFHSSFSCCSSSGSPASYRCRRKTTAVPSPTTLPGPSTPCSDTPTALLPSEPSGRCPQRCGAGGRRGVRPKAIPTSRRGPERWRSPPCGDFSPYPNHGFRGG